MPFPCRASGSEGSWSLLDCPVRVPEQQEGQWRAQLGGRHQVAAGPGQQQHGGQGVVPEQQEGQWRAQLAGRHQVAAGPASKSF